MAEFNPFEHHHHHDHEDPEVLRRDLDPAQQSLADALKVSFTLLKVIMLVLALIYAFSGVFTVGTDEYAIRLRFGKIVVVDSQTGRKVLTEGGVNFALPYPIEQVVRIPKAVQQIDLNEEFWFELTEQDKGKTLDEMAGTAKPLNPERDGSLLTGDANIAHARWTISYIIADPVSFITNIGDPTNPDSVIDAANNLVRSVAAQGVVYTVAQLEADRLQKGLRESDFAIARKRMQDALDALASGIEITNVSAQRIIFPLSVQADFQAVIDAENEKSQAIEQAQQERAQILGETAGEAYGPLLKLVEAFEEASRGADDAKRAALEKQFDQAFDTLTVARSGGQGEVAIGGKVAQVINQARTYRTQVVAQTRGKAEYVQTLRKGYEANPDIVRNDLWQAMVRKVFRGDEVEVFFMPPGELYLELNRDPRLEEERDRRRNQRIEQERQGEQGPDAAP